MYNFDNSGHRYEHHLNGLEDDYESLYGYDINHLYEWSIANDDGWLSMESLLCYTLNIYGHILTAAIDFNVGSVLDIGCGYGRQSKMFAESNISYYGLELSHTPFYGLDRPDCELIIAEYPACGNIVGADAAISSHCVGTGILWEPEAIADDFDVFIGNCYVDFFDELFPLYNNQMIINTDTTVLNPDDGIPMMIAACWN